MLRWNCPRVGLLSIVVPTLVGIAAGLLLPPGAQACSCPELKPACDINEHPQKVFYGRVIEVSYDADLWLGFLGGHNRGLPSKAEPENKSESEEERRWRTLEAARKPIRDHLTPIMSIEQKQLLEAADSMMELSVLVNELRRTEKDRLVRFEVLEAFRNVTDPEVLVVTKMPGGGNCVPGFRLGEEYLVYARQGWKYGPIWASGCTRIASAKYAGPDLEFWRNYDPDSGKGRVFGLVGTHNGFEGVGSPGGIVTLEGHGVKRSLTTDEEGRYSFDGLPAGDYQLSAVLGGLRIHDSPREATLASGGCSSQDFYGIPRGRIVGQVVDASGTPVAREHLDVIAVSPGRRGNSRSVWTYENGRFRAEALAPGQYVLGINLHSPPRAGESGSLASPFPKTYYPSGSTKDFAQRIEVGARDESLEVDWTLPPRLEERVFEGKVLWSDGKPVSVGFIELQDPDYENRETHKLRLPEDGSFQLVGFKGYTYEIKVHGSESYGPEGLERFRKTVTVHPEDERMFTIVLDATSTEKPPRSRVDRILRGGRPDVE